MPSELRTGYIGTLTPLVVGYIHCDTFTHRDTYEVNVTYCVVSSNCLTRCVISEFARIKLKCLEGVNMYLTSLGIVIHMPVSTTSTTT